MTERKSPGAPLPFSGTFDWAGSHWVAPGVYAAPEALLVDLCRQVDPGAVKAFYEKWRPVSERDCTREEADHIQAESPLAFSFGAAAQVNGRELPMERSSGTGYVPFCREEGEHGLEAALRYGLDQSQCWQICRCVFPWESIPQVESLSICLKAHPAPLPGRPFSIQPGEEVELIHPQTGERYVLTALELATDTVERGFPGLEGWDVPTHLWKLTYTLEPGLEGFSLQDREDGDPIRPKAPQPGDVLAGAASVGVVGGTVGVASIGVIGGAFGQQAEHRVALSSLRFEPAESVVWYPLFPGSPIPDATIPLLP